jgi:two-component system phosphate regulon response regulator OmpR
MNRALPEIDALGRQAHILIVDDDDRIRTLLKDFLTRCGARVSAAAHAEGARRLLASFDFDLLIIDVMMPQEDGFSLLESLRKTSSAPMFLLTARGDPQDRIKGLQIGADDYVPKPFDPEELALRINNTLRRTQVRSAAVQESVRFGPNVFHTGRSELTRDGLAVRLTEAEAQLLKVLAARGGESISREELARRTGAGLERSVDVQVTRLRRKIEPDARNPIYLQTVRGIGYRLAID